MDNFKIGESICEYLLNRNHRDVAFIGGNKIIFSNLERMHGYKAALEKKNIKLTNDYIVHGAFTVESGREACNKLLKKKIPITAICCANDNIAVGALQCLQDNNIKVPENVSLISVGNLPISGYSIPAITTAAIPLYELGVKSTEFLCGKYKMKEEILKLPFKIIERDSVIKL